MVPMPSIIIMMSGKAISRALRGDFLVEAALVNKLIAVVLPAELERNDDSIENVDGDDDRHTNQEDKHLIKTLSLKDTVKEDNKYSNKHRHMAL